MKNTLKFICISIVLIIVALTFRNCSCERKKTVSKKQVSNNSNALTNPPIPELDIPYQNFKINPNTSVVLYSKYGTEIKIPAKAFLDENGNKIKNEVELSFREFYNPLDFYLAGIPMNYEESGIVKAFE
ncbi:hypothetical protein [Flavobacterium gawalongense]|uniref:Uncharacterized protein n=1 Tax=Flavobacterium gawalongense TaxID=2594432 RepID=A0A553BDC9_9FLAO|nr:hypothetical protein [Flavobacterium gawalongense]TRX01344.1 hypothetical protein FNW33_09530 [Flavobacterium gawalongense]TRX05868.1 hypothetical protein FNW12_09615 [Flavobacterium gawalongense]TRX06254.1 hypothetical protein FNW11_14775 [Flavobacterium gawalongense]TRX06998.1 hypothetical protein FNW10_15135 [Flavobacterium gawalongense]TRX23113.1 hypothetical protein FNW38_15185 [Flavobacterium gawalongense]